MTDRRYQPVPHAHNPEPLPAEFGVDLVRLDHVLGEVMSDVEAPIGLAGRVCSASAGFLAPPASIPLRSPSPQFVLRQKRTMWARVAVAASLGALCLLAVRIVVQNGSIVEPTNEVELATQRPSEQSLPNAVELVLLDRTAHRSSEEIAYFFDPDPRDSSEMSLFVQTRDVTLDEVSVELALLEADLSM